MNTESSNASLLQKYNVPGPRYTSYPTVPYWTQEGFNREFWIQSVQRSFHEDKEQGISLYIHLPFCESLCTFCACHKRITKQHSVERPYINAILKEWALYLDILGEKPKIKEIHLGGGTPTFFSPSNLELLINGILSTSNLCEEFEFSFEGHPNNTTRAHLKVLYDLGFTRTSFGVQDYDPLVQLTINRVQPFENVKRVTLEAREIGYTSISHDLVFGLPHQTLESMINTINLTKELLPDRLAFYSYAHVPWVKNVGQRGYKETDLPSPSLKRAMYEHGKVLLGEIGYQEIGMDHFALESDSMFKSMQSGSLHRNFMGYTTNTTQLMIGLGMSSISDSWYGFAQNKKTVEAYVESVKKGELPVFRGHHLKGEDLVVRKHILNLMCTFQTSWNDEKMMFNGLDHVVDRLSELEKDDIIILKDNSIVVEEKYRPYVRNVCMAFDLHLHKAKPQTRVFSMTI